MSAIPPISPHAIENENTPSHVPGRSTNKASEVAQKQLNQPASLQSGLKKRKVRAHSEEFSDTDREADGSAKKLKPNDVPAAVVEKLQNLMDNLFNEEKNQTGGLQRIKELVRITDEIDSLKSRYYMITKDQGEVSLRTIEPMLRDRLLEYPNDSELLSLLGDILRKRSLLLHGYERTTTFVEAIVKNEESLRIDPTNAFAINLSGKIFASWFLDLSTGTERKRSGELAERKLKQTLHLKDIESIELLAKVLIKKSIDLNDKEEAKRKVEEVKDLFVKALDMEPENLRISTTSAVFMIIHWMPVFEGELKATKSEEGKEILRDLYEQLTEKLAKFPYNNCLMEDLFQVLYTQIYNNLCPEEIDKKFEQMRSLIEKHEKLEIDLPQTKIWWSRFFFLRSRHKKGYEAYLLKQAVSNLADAISFKPECRNIKNEQLKYMTSLVEFLEGSERKEMLQKLKGLLAERLVEDPNDINLKLQLEKVLALKAEFLREDRKSREGTHRDDSDKA
ncbi:MAG: hypothetical protein WAM28_07885 [Chlamydiales bacterium]